MQYVIKVNNDIKLTSQLNKTLIYLTKFGQNIEWASGNFLSNTIKINRWVQSDATTYNNSLTKYSINEGLLTNQALIKKAEELHPAALENHGTTALSNYVNAGFTQYVAVVEETYDSVALSVNNGNVAWQKVSFGTKKWVTQTNAGQHMPGWTPIVFREDYYDATPPSDWAAYVETQKSASTCNEGDYALCYVFYSFIGLSQYTYAKVVVE